MKYTSSELSRYLTWSRVLPLLNVHPKVLSLPAVTDCPICHGQRLHIFADATRNGQWYRCLDCKSCGDMVDLTMNSKKLDAEAAVKYLLLLSSCSMDRDTQLVKELRRRRYLQSFRKFFEDSSDFARKSSELNRLADNLGTNCVPVSGVWSDTHKMIFRGGDARALELCYAPEAALQGGRKQSKGSLINNPSEERVFRGSSWQHIFVIPFHSLPGQLSAVAAIGRLGRPDEDVLFKLLQHRLNRPDAGAAVHPVFYDTPVPTLFCINEPIQYLKLYSQHLTAENTPLPLVLWCESGNYFPHAVWQHLRTDEYVFFIDRLTPAVVNQLVLTDGCGFQPSGVDTSLQHCVQNNAPQQFFSLMRRKAVHWSVLLRDFLAKADDEQIDSMFCGLEERGLALSRIFSILGSDLEQRVAQLRRKSPMRTLKIGRNILIEERDNGWFVADTDELVSEAMLYVNESVSFSRFNCTYFRGYVRFRGVDVDFCADSRLVLADPVVAVYNCVYSAQLGLPKFGHRWRKRLYEISSALCDPVVLDGIDTIGWDQKRSEFVFPRLIIGTNGAEEHNEMVYPEEMPAVHIGKPIVGPDSFTGLLDETSGNRCFWAAWLLLLRNIMSPVHNENTFGIAVAGDTAVAAASNVCRAMGLFDYRMTSKTVDSVFAMEFRHHYPISVGLDVRTLAATERWLNSSSYKHRNNLTAATELQAYSAGMTGRWLPVVHDSFSDVPEFDDRWTTLMPGYLEYAGKRNFRLPANSNYLAAVIEHVSNWMLETVGSCDIIDSARTLLLPEAGTVLDSFIRTVRWLLQNNCLELPVDGVLVVDKRVFQSGLQKHNAVKARLDALTRTLRAANCLAAASGETGWILTEEFTSQMKDSVLISL